MLRFAALLLRRGERRHEVGHASRRPRRYNQLPPAGGPAGTTRRNTPTTCRHRYRAFDKLPGINPTGGWRRPGGRSVSDFDATAVELQFCGSMLAQISDDVRANVQALQAQMDSLLTSGWQGKASEGFALGWEQWRIGAGDVLDGLQAMGELLGATGRTYDFAEQDATQGLWQAGEGL